MEAAHKTINCICSMYNDMYVYYASHIICIGLFGHLFPPSWHLFLFPQILETIPISDEVSDLVQKLGNFYTEVYRDGEEAEESDVDRRPFTRPFAQHTTGNIHDCCCQGNSDDGIQAGEGPVALLYH